MKLSTCLAAVGLAGAMTLTAACSGADTGSAEGTANVDVSKLKLTPTTAAAKGAVDSVNWLLEDEPESLDLDTQGGSAGRTVLSNVCERLYQLQPDMSVSPSLVARETRPDARTLVLTLRDDVTFHDGSAMTADDVLSSLRRHAEPEMEQSDEFANVSRMTKTGDREITVAFKQPDALFTKALAGDAGLVYNREQVEKAGDDFGTPGQGDACSGPYELTGWKSGDSITLTRSDDYWGEQPLTKRVVFRWAADSAMVNALSTGAADGAYLDTVSSAAALRGSPASTSTTDRAPPPSPSSPPNAADSPTPTSARPCPWPSTARASPSPATADSFSRGPPPSAPGPGATRRPRSKPPRSSSPAPPPSPTRRIWPRRRTSSRTPSPRPTPPS